jgi:hypothetical protein
MNGQFPLTSEPLPHAQDLCCALGFASRLIVLKQRRLKSRTNCLTVQLLRSYTDAVKSHELTASLHKTLHFTSHCTKRRGFTLFDHFVFPFIPCGLCQSSHTKFKDAVITTSISVISNPRRLERNI